ncbi:MAG: FAD:protein FMN transferase [Ekhidna sp.]
MKKIPLLVFGMALILAFAFYTYTNKDVKPMNHITGVTMGGIVYNVKFKGEHKAFKQEIDQLLYAFNQSLSTYISDSEISEFNREGNFSYKSDYFLPVLEISKEVFNATAGSFDPTIGPLVQAWGFGPDKKIPDLDSVKVDSLRSIVGFQNVIFDLLSVSMPTNYQLDFSAIAKGYAVDVIGEFLEREGVEDYLVEIGGEVRCRGLNDQMKSWSLGIEDPTVNNAAREILAIVRLNNRSLATSGNYRNFYEKEGQLYAHIIDPRTGYTAKHSLLSASVFASDCIVADAYATAFMVMGLEQSRTILNNQSNLDAIFVFRDVNGKLQTYVSDGIKPFVELNKTTDKN